MPSASRKRRRVAVVGAGPSGLVAAKSLQEEGLEPVVFEQADGVGGQWHGPSAHSGVWPGMRANTSKTLDAFSDFPPAESLPMFPRVEELRDYLRSYAQAFDLNRSIRLKTPVRHVERDDGRWRVITDTGGERFDGVVVASGRFNRPHRPVIAGLESFTGEVVHSFHYRGRDAFRGKRVVVLGNSVSGTEIASDLAIDDSIRVTASLRKPRYVIPRVSRGVPSDWRFFTRFSAYLPMALPPEAVADNLKRSILDVSGHPSQYGAPAPHENILVAHITLCQHWLAYVAEGRIHCRPALVGVRGRTVVFADGREEEADAIVTATGYDLSLPFLPEDVRRTVNADPTALDLYVHTFHPDLSGLAFTGQYILIGPYVPCVELQARWIAMVWSGVRELPPRDRMRCGIEAWHVATTPLYYVSEVFKLPTQSGWDLDSARPPTTTAGLVQALDDIYDEIVAALRTKDDAWLDDRKTARRCRNTSITKAKETRVVPACLSDAHVHVDRREGVVELFGARQRRGLVILARCGLQ
jgi:dimethylaniline monooxygenase (N-oxide forming)